MMTPTTERPLRSPMRSAIVALLLLALAGFAVGVREGPCDGGDCLGGSLAQLSAARDADAKEAAAVADAAKASAGASAVSAFAAAGVGSSSAAAAAQVGTVANEQEDDEFAVEDHFYAAMGLEAPKRGCAQYGCVGYRVKQTCQCNILCKYYGNCCTDYKAICQKDASVGEPVTTDLLFKFWGAAFTIFISVALVVTGAIPVIQAQIAANRAATGDLRAGMGSVVDEAKLLRSWFSMRFKNSKEEELWQKDSRIRKVADSARTLTFVAIVLVLYRGIRAIQGYRAACGMTLYPGMKVCEFAVLFASMGGSMYCWQHPREELFWPLLGFFFFYVPASGLPPLMWSCYELKNGCQAASDWYIKEAVASVDCSLQGHTTMQMLMTWLLLQPWLIPRLDYMHLLWLWIFGVYLTWTFLYRHFTDDRVFDSIDVGYRVFLLCVSLVIAIGKKYSLESSQRLRFLQDLQERESTKKIFNIFEAMVPEHVVGRMLKNVAKEQDDCEPIAERVECVSILFVLIADFDHFTHKKTPAELLRFLNQQFTAFDKICMANQVTKIETVGEEYVACVGVLPQDIELNRQHGHGPLLERLCMAAGEMLHRQTDDGEDSVKYKMGIHSGPIVAGVIGHKLPRYRLFGDTINSAARMMQKGLPGQLQFGKETYALLSPELKEKVKLRGEVEMKGKGKILAYTYEPEPLAVEPPMSFTASQAGKMSNNQDSEIVMASMRLHRKGLEDDDEEEPDRLTQRERGRADAAAEAAAADRFKAALEAMKDPSSEASGRWLLPEKDGFTPEMEQAWFLHFHERIFANKIMRRFGAEAMMVMFLTGCELAFMIKVNIWKYSHALYNSGLRWPIFVYTRGVIVLIAMLNWQISESTDWMLKRPRATQAWVLVTSCFSIFLMFVSYDALVFSDTPGYRKHTNFAEHFRAPEDQSLTLNFVLVVFLITRLHAFLFYPSLAFVPMAVVAMSIHYAYAWVLPKAPAWEDIFSFQGELLVVVQVLLNISVAYEDEENSRARYKAQKAVEETQKRTKKILDSLMPPLVVKGLNLKDPVTSHPYRHATIAQSDLCGFTALSATKSPEEVVGFMGDLFGKFDELTDKHGVYKVETIGDAYIAGMAEQPLTPENSPVHVIWFALDMVRACDKWALNLGVKVACRVGVAYGECIGGIVGTGMQRYHLFGDLLTIMDVLEATSQEGRVQVSGACKQEVERQLKEFQGEMKERVTFEKRDVPHLQTSKGEVHEFQEVGGQTFLVNSNFPLRHTLQDQLRLAEPR